MLDSHETIRDMANELAAKDAEIAKLREALNSMPELTLRFKTKRDMEAWTAWRDDVYTIALEGE